MRKQAATWIAGLFLAALALTADGCSLDNAKKHYILAEKLWADGKYEPAVAEFEETVKRDPKGKLGLQALFRAAMTQTLFLSQHRDALKKLRSFANLSTDTEAVWMAEKEIGNIYFEKLREYRKSITHYVELLKQGVSEEDAPEFIYRIGRARFFLWEFEKAVESYRRVIREFPSSTWSEKAAFQVGATLYTSGERYQGAGEEKRRKIYEEAMAAHENFLKEHPLSESVVEARFGIAACLEELDRLDEAYQKYSEIQDAYPSPEVIRIKLIRIRERLEERNR